ncbi:MAG TPA: cytochrome c biogenesis protein CcsA [Candidatus Hydrogenedentes bacterium]|nr:cytochrome c biogenesis protein CcsA [Candidatus Hydrogenedentota bacterium]
MNLASKCIVLFAAALVALAAGAQTPVSLTSTPPMKWDPKVVELFSTLPIQEGGRVKPLSTFAGFTLLKLNGKRDTTVEINGEKRKLTAMEWMLDVMFYPEVAENYPIFIVDSSAVLDALDIKHDDKKRRDRYSYNELHPGVGKLFQLAQEYQTRAEGDTKNLTPTEGQIVDLANSVFAFQKVRHYLDFARYEFDLKQGSVLSEILPAPRMTAVLAKETQLGVLAYVLENGIENLEPQLTPEQMQQLREALPPSFATLDETQRAETATQIGNIMQDARLMMGRAMGMAVFPPAKGMEDQEHWLTAAQVFEHASHEHEGVAEQVGMLVDLEELVRQRDNSPAFMEQLTRFHGEITTLATTRGEYSLVPLEVKYYNWDLLYKSLVLFVLAFLATTVAWLASSKRWVSNIATALLFPPTILLIGAIVLRCIIRQRPPVSTLYETILFITACAVVVAIIMELINRQRIAMSIGSILGAVGLFLAYRFEAQQGVDTMPQLIAVLDTNFWLATHVTTVTIGYSAGLLAAAIGHVYILGKLLGLKRGDEAFYKGIYRMTYGVVCFGLLFATVGTVLGGIWANDSWGRFWGWDPKENGALMIVLWFLAILHARLGGYIRDLGVAMASTFGAIIVAFSWWGVNLLGVGLHSYGFTSGIMPWLLSFYVLELVVTLLGFVVWFQQRSAVRSHAVGDAPVTTPPRKKPLPAKAQE